MSRGPHKPAPGKTLLIIWHSRTGGALQMARSAARAARSEPAVLTRLVRAARAGPLDVEAADGLILACPENLGAPSGEMKEFLDRAYYPLLERVEGRACALMICAGTDGEGAARQLARVCAGWRLRMIAEPLIVRTGAQTPEAIFSRKTLDAEALQRCGELGATMAAGLEMGIW